MWKINLTNTDTIINSVSYRKMNDSTGYLGGFREDTILRTVYFFPKDSLMEQVLYDFNLQIGDTVGPAYIGCYPYVYVASIDSTSQFGNGYRKTFQLSGAIWAPYSLIEGIGTSGGVFVPYCMNDGYFYELHCYSVDDSLIYWSGIPFLNCNLPVSISENYPTGSEIKIYPVPAHSTITVSVDKDFENSELMIYNLLGELIGIMKATSNPGIFNIEQFNAGIYICKILNGNGYLAAGKFVVK